MRSLYRKEGATAVEAAAAAANSSMWTGSVSDRRRHVVAQYPTPLAPTARRLSSPATERAAIGLSGKVRGAGFHGVQFHDSHDGRRANDSRRQIRRGAGGHHLRRRRGRHGQEPPRRRGHPVIRRDHGFARRPAAAKLPTPTPQARPRRGGTWRWRRPVPPRPRRPSPQWRVPGGETAREEQRHHRARRVTPTPGQWGERGGEGRVLVRTATRRPCSKRIDERVQHSRGCMHSDPCAEGLQSDLCKTLVHPWIYGSTRRSLSPRCHDRTRVELLYTWQDLRPDSKQKTKM